MKLPRSIFTTTALALGAMIMSTGMGCSQAEHGAMKDAKMPAKAMSNAKVMISPSPVPYQSKVKVTISGNGFAPNQDLELLIPIGEVLTDISSLVKPKPKTDGKGAFSTEWVLNNEIKLMQPKQYTLEVSNTEGETLAKAPFVLEKVKKQ